MNWHNATMCSPNLIFFVPFGAVVYSVINMKLMDELAQCYNVLPQLDINNTIDHRPEGDEKWFLENEKTVTQFCRSEERRVGKESRSRCSSDHDRKKIG